MEILHEADSLVIGERGKEWTDAVAPILERFGEAQGDLALCRVARHVSVLDVVHCSGVDFDAVCAV
jgi:hypothetical protein